MKKISFIILSVVGVGLTFFNYSARSNRSELKRNENQLSNIHALQASAGEAYCDGKTTASCTIKAGPATGTGTGNAVYQ